MRHFKILSGPAYEICQKHDQKHQEEIRKLNSIIEKYRAVKDRYSSCGPQIVSLYFGLFSNAPSGWVPTKNGYFKPNKRTKLGKAIFEELDIIRLPSTEKLAIDLGCRPFFTDFDDGKQYCANIDIFQSKNIIYLESHKWCQPDTKKYPEIQSILGSEWHKASEEK